MLVVSGEGGFNSLTLLNWYVDLYVYVLLVSGSYDCTAVLLGQDTHVKDIFNLKRFFSLLE